MVFPDALATAPWTLPSHASMFTGVYPPRHEARCSWAPFSRQLPTLAERLSSRGYDTVSFNGGGNIAGGFGFDRGFDVYRSFGFGFGLDDRDAYRKSNPTLPIEKGIEWLDARTRGPTATERKRRPFFLFLHSYEPHSPYYDRRRDSFTSFRTLRRLQASRAPALLQKVLADYEGGVHWADRAVGRLVARLEESGLLDKTIVVLTSDHGEGFLEHGLLNHSVKLYPEFLHVPLVIYSPRHPPSVLPLPASIVDIMPTVLDLLGEDVDPSIDGRSLLGSIDPMRSRFAEVCLDPGAGKRMIRERVISRDDASSLLVAKGRWRLIYNYRRGTHELYDLESDPGAHNNLAGKDPDTAAGLKKELIEWFGRSGQLPLAGLGVEPIRRQ